MSKDLKIDEGGDLVMENGSPVFVEGLEEVAQAIRLLVSTPKGSFLDTDYGMDFNFLLGGYDEKAAYIAVEDAINQDKRVVEIPSLDIEPDYLAGVVRITAGIVTTMGDININQEVPLNAIE